MFVGDFQPSCLPLWQLQHPKHPSYFPAIVIKFLKAHRLSNPEVIRDFADPQSPTYRHLHDTYFSICSSQEPGKGMTEDERGAWFHEAVISVVKEAMDFGGFLELQKMAPKHHDDAENPKPVPTPSSAPMQTRVVPPSRPRLMFGMKPEVQPAIISTNTIYISKLKDGVNKDHHKLIDTLDALRFPTDLVHASTKLRPYKEGPINQCFLEGPEDDPSWAKKMIEAKKFSNIKDTIIHMALAHPKRPTSPDRPIRVEELEAKLAKISLGGSPKPSRPAQDSGRSGNKRPLEGIMRLFSGSNDEVETSPVTGKKHNTSATPFLFKRGSSGEERKKEDDNRMVSTPNSKSGSENGRTYKEALADSLEVRAGAATEDNKADFDDALTPPTTPTNKKEGGVEDSSN
jgi:hypothetical protein